MNKKLIRLTESDLHRIVKESVNRVLNEIDYSQMPLGDYYERNNWFRQQTDADFPNHGIEDSGDWQNTYNTLAQNRDDAQKAQRKKLRDERQKEKLNSIMIEIKQKIKEFVDKYGGYFLKTDINDRFIYLDMGYDYKHDLPNVLINLSGLRYGCVEFDPGYHGQNDEFKYDAEQLADYISNMDEKLFKKNNPHFMTQCLKKYFSNKSVG